MRHPLPAVFERALCMHTENGAENPSQESDCNGLSSGDGLGQNVGLGWE